MPIWPMGPRAVGLGGAQEPADGGVVLNLRLLRPLGLRAEAGDDAVLGGGEVGVGISGKHTQELGLEPLGAGGGHRGVSAPRR